MVSSLLASFAMVIAKLEAALKVAIVMAHVVFLHIL